MKSIIEMNICAFVGLVLAKYVEILYRDEGIEGILELTKDVWQIRQNTFPQFSSHVLF